MRVRAWATGVPTRRCTPTTSNGRFLVAGARTFHHDAMASIRSYSGLFQHEHTAAPPLALRRTWARSCRRRAAVSSGWTPDMQPCTTPDTPSASQWREFVRAPHAYERDCGAHGSTCTTGQSVPDTTTEPTRPTPTMSSDLSSSIRSL